MSKTIISYRENDTAQQAKWLIEALQHYLGVENAIRTTKALAGSSVNAVEALERGLSDADALIVLIGSNWSGIWFANPNNDDRIALNVALRERKRIIPVLVNSASLPANLPDDLAALGRRTALPLRDDTFREDAAKIAEATGIPLVVSAGSGTDIPDDFPDLKLSPIEPPKSTSYSSFGASERPVYVFGDPEDRGKDKLKVKAGAGARFGAYLIDAMILAMLGFVVGLCLGVGTVTTTRSSFTSSSVSSLQCISYLIGIGMQVAYYCYFLTAWNGQTPGKRALKLRVVRLDGEPITVGTALARNVFGYFISGVAVWLGFLWIFFDERGQGWHDKIAGTMVIRDE